MEDIEYLNNKINLGIASPADIKKRDAMQKKMDEKSFYPIFETIQTARCKKVEQ